MTEAALPMLTDDAREFALLPSGARFRFPNEDPDEVWIKVGRHMCQLSRPVVRTVGDLMRVVTPAAVE